MTSFDTIIEAYNAKVSDLPRLHKEDGGGKARNASGVIFENFIQRICNCLGIESKKNDYKKTVEINKYILKIHQYNQKTSVIAK